MNTLSHAFPRLGQLLLAFALSLAMPVSLQAENPKKGKPPASPSSAGPKKIPEKHDGTAAYKWLDIILEATAREVDRHGARPTIISRTVQIPIIAMYDAWAAYDAKALGTQLGATLRRPEAERTDANRVVAIAFASYRALLDMYPEDKEWLDGMFSEQGYNPSEMTTDLSRPEGVGNVASAAVVKSRHHDGANQLGDEVGSKGAAYSDYTFYSPINPVDKIIDPDRWQPIPFDDGKGGKIVLGFLTPHWYRVRPVMLERSDMFRPGPPPKVGSDQLLAETKECIELNATLTPEQKAIVEFMRDGPRSTGQSGHWLRFAQDVSRRDNNNLERDVKLFFSVGGVAMDAFIACWEAKRFYDSSRPWTLVRHYFKGQKIRGWAGPGKGVILLPAEEWHPYSPATFITPPFPAFPSGHSTVSGAASKMLELFTGSDNFGATEERHAGMLTEAGFECQQMQAIDGKPGDPSLTCDVALRLPTFSATAEMAGISRVMGGYHIQADNVEGLALGRKIAAHTWPKYQALFDGTATVPAPEHAAANP